MHVQSKKTFAAVDYETCNPSLCSPDDGICPAASACSHKVIKQIDDAFQPPMIFQDICLGCGDCIESCPLNAVRMKLVA